MRSSPAPKPVIAAMHGTILGGGLEIAMACHYRCATRTARFGMPEITLGILPGAGGTQRLPRLVGLENALDMLLSGAPVDGARALELGLIDEVVPDDVVDGGIAFARRLLEKNARPRLTRSKPAPSALTDAMIATGLARHARGLKGRTTQNLVIEALRAARQLSFDEGLALESRAVRRIARVHGIPGTSTCFFCRAGLRSDAAANGAPVAACRGQSRSRRWRRHHGIRHRHGIGGRRHSCRVD